MPHWKSLFSSSKRPTTAAEDYARLNDGRYAKRECIVVRPSDPIRIGLTKQPPSTPDDASLFQTSSAHSHHGHNRRHWRGIALNQSHRSTSSISVRFGEVIYDRPQTANQPSTARYAKPPRSIMKHSPVSETSLICRGSLSHPLLAYPDARLRYQVLRQPSSRSISVGSPAVCMPGIEFDEPATHPPMQSSITIVSRYLPWRISVRAHRSKSKGEDVHSRRNYITVSDVLQALHTSLAKAISKTDWETLSPEQQKRITRAYETRCQGMGGDQWERGVRRVDWLKRRLYFAGLIPASEDGQVWEAVFLDSRT